MANTSLFKKLLAISPRVELAIRHLYWKNIKYLRRFNQKDGPKKPTLGRGGKVEVCQIINFLRKKGVNKGSLLIVHSAYRALKPLGLSPEQIIDELINLVGESGTLAMPAMPKFKNEVQDQDYLTKNVSDIVFDFDVQSTPISTGVLPQVLFAKSDSIRSRFPINTMVARGKLARAMMKNNFAGDHPLACGVGSSWHYCAQAGGIIVGLGVDLTHSLTMIHVAEDAHEEKWPIKNWYRNKQFHIRDGTFERNVTLRERDPRWGTLHFAERTLCKDLIAAGILESKSFGGILIEIMDAKQLIDFLMSKNSDGYPYHFFRPSKLRNIY